MLSSAAEAHQASIKSRRLAIKVSPGCYSCLNKLFQSQLDLANIVASNSELEDRTERAVAILDQATKQTKAMIDKVPSRKAEIRKVQNIEKTRNAAEPWPERFREATRVILEESEGQ